MRIAIDYTAAINQQAGIGRFTRNLVKALAALDSENQYVLLCARPNPGVQPTYPQAPNFVRRHLRVSERTMTILWHRMRLPIHAEWLTGPVDIFHSPDFVLPYLGSSRGVVTIHDLAFILYPECAEPSLREYLDRVVPHAAARATFVVADSEHTRNDTICLLDVPPERVAVVPGGVEDHFQPVTDPERLARARQLVGTEAPFILYVGTIEPRKNLERLIAAYDLLKARYQLPHKLVLAGKRGWLWEGIVRRAEQSPYRDDLLWPGFIPEELLPALYSVADLFVFPSLYEGFGLPPLEAMACGTPVVCSNTSSLPEVVGEAAVMVEPTSVEALADAMFQVLSNDELRGDLRRRGLAQARRFRWEDSATRLLAVYQQVASL